MRLSLLYRGPLASCDYDCHYCPFAKRRDSLTALAEDRSALERFSGWAAAFEGELSVLFTPWGEALVRPWYREAIVHLSHLPQVARVAIQTNLSGPLGFVERADRRRLALWCTYHPTQVRRSRFLDRCRQLDEAGARHSVGIVGLPEHLDEARAVRAALAPATYLWVNAAEGRRYDAGEVADWTAIDPLFAYSAEAHASRGDRCRTGDDVLSVRGDGTVTRCHFVPEVLGNLYDGSFLERLGPKPCPNRVCDCHIGYVNLERLGLDAVFGPGRLERIPLGWPDLDQRAAWPAMWSSTAE